MYSARVTLQFEYLLVFILSFSWCPCRRSDRVDRESLKGNSTCVTHQSLLPGSNFSLQAVSCCINVAESDFVYLHLYLMASLLLLLLLCLFWLLAAVVGTLPPKTVKQL